jgi:hypothetical protein
MIEQLTQRQFGSRPGHVHTPSRYMECAASRSWPDIAPFRTAEVILERCQQRSTDGGRWRLDDAEAACIAPLLVMHDAQLANLPRHYYLHAWKALVKAVEDDRRHLHRTPGRSLPTRWSGCCRTL